MLTQPWLQKISMFPFSYILNKWFQHIDRGSQTVQVKGHKYIKGKQRCKTVMCEIELEVHEILFDKKHCCVAPIYTRAHSKN